MNALVATGHYEALAGQSLPFGQCRRAVGLALTLRLPSAHSLTGATPANPPLQADPAAMSLTVVQIRGAPRLPAT